jgi:type IV secretory pathway VirB2 component (pilin)
MAKLFPMNNILNIVIAVLILAWLVGYIGFGTAVGSVIHILLVLAAVAIVVRLLTGRKAV